MLKSKLAFLICGTLLYSKSCDFTLAQTCTGLSLKFLIQEIKRDGDK